MQETRVAKVYATALIRLGDELEIDVASELTKFNDIIAQSNDLENLLFLDLFTVQEKKDVFLKLAEKSKMSKLLENYILFLLEERRMNIFPMIWKEVIVMDDHKKGFIRGVIEGTEVSIDEANKSELMKYLEAKLKVKPHLEYQQNDKITAGYKVTVGDMQLDASADEKLKRFKDTVLEK